MRVSRTFLLLMACLAIAPLACRSTQDSRQASPLSAQKPVKSASLPTTVTEGPPAPTAAETIASRARQDLLESMAIGQNTPNPTALPSAQTKPVVTWEGTTTSPADSGTNPTTSATVDSPTGTLAATISDTATTTVDITTLCDALARALHNRSRDGTTPMRDLTVLAALAMLDADRALHTEALNALTEDEQIALQAIQQWFLAMEVGLDDQEAVLDSVLESVRGLQASLRRTPRFGMSDTSLVTRVGGFGDVDDWALRNEQEQYNFIAHTGQEIILYMELEGFDSRLDEDGRWETSTSQQLIIYSDRDGIPVWREPWQTTTDHAGTKRKDYFTAQKLAIPTNLSVGKYQLKVRVRDEYSQAETETTIPFVMTAAVLAP
ncbi:MAG: hypothetical protein VX527_02290 [Planctomycetota bacterium]|nr:hypothetical protein [Planctomycetota bacterium]